MWTFVVFMSCFSFCFVFYFFWWKNTFYLASSLVPTSNNITNNQPVPSVCVRVPHSPSLDDSGDGESPASPVDKTHHHDFTTLVVRESSTRIIYQINKIQIFFSHSKKNYFVCSQKKKCLSKSNLSIFIVISLLPYAFCACYFAISWFCRYYLWAFRDSSFCNFCKNVEFTRGRSLITWCRGEGGMKIC